jgi:hypothetical protein
MVGEVVVVLHGVEGGFLAVHSQVVDWHGLRKERLKGVYHGETGAEDGHQTDCGGGDGLCFVLVA